MGEGRTSVILQWSNHRIDIDLVAHGCQNAAAIVVAKVLTVRGSSTVINDVCPKARSLKNSVPNRCGPAIVDAAGELMPCKVSAKSAVAHCQRPRFVIDAAADAFAAGGGGPVTGNSAVGHSQRRVAVGAIVVDAATGPAGVTTADRAAIERQCSVIVVNAATAGQAGELDVAIRDGQAGDGGGNPTAHVEAAAGKVAINCQVTRTRPVDGNTLVHQQFAGGQSNSAGDSQVDSVAV